MPTNPCTIPLLENSARCTRKQQVQQRRGGPLQEDQDLDHRGRTGHTKIKVVLVGDGAVGKSSLIVSYAKNGFPPEYQPTAFDTYNVMVNVDEQPINIQLCDTAGQDDLDSIRSLCYPETDVFLICFSIVSPTSYKNVELKWFKEVHQHCPNTPIILIGTKSDLRSDVRSKLQLARYGQAPITTIQGHQLANRIGASSYIETSALTQKDLKKAFDQAISSALVLKEETIFLKNKKQPSRWHKWLCCCICCCNRSSSKIA